MADNAPLYSALGVIRARGAIGERSLADAVAHADRFVSLIPPDARTVVDLGSGGGLPGLVIAWRRPDVHVTMVERRATRADLLQRAVAGLQMSDRVAVLATDVAVVCRQLPRSFDVVTARSFGDPGLTAGFIDQLLAPDGVGLISEPPAERTDVWAEALRKSPALTDGGLDLGIRRLKRPAVAT